MHVQVNVYAQVFPRDQESWKVEFPVTFLLTTLQQKGVHTDYLFNEAYVMALDC